MDRCRCGWAPDPGDRFCSRCGAAAVGDFNTVGTTGEALTSDRVRLAAYGAAGLLLLLVGLLVWPGGPPADERTDDRPVEDRDPAITLGIDQGRVESTAGQRAGDSTDQSAQPSADPKTEQSSPQADVSARPRTVDDGPVVGEPTGLGLIIGQRPFTTMRLLDLDTGAVHRLAAQGEPVGVIGSSLVFRRDERVLTATLDTADDTGTGLADGTGGWVEIASITDNRLWATPDGRTAPEGRVLVGFDEAGDPVDEVTIPRGHTTFGRDPYAELIQNAGGIFRRTGDGYRRVSDANLLLAGEQLVLVEDCDDAMVCGRRWYQRSNWVGPLDLPVPDLPSQGWGAIVGDDRWMVIMDRTAGSLTLHSLTDGRPARTLGQTGPAGSGGVALSPDGRWLVEQTTAGLELVDLDNGASWLYVGQPIEPESVVVFVALDRVGFLKP